MVRLNKQKTLLLVLVSLVFSIFLFGCVQQLPGAEEAEEVGETSELSASPTLEAVLPEASPETEIEKRIERYVIEAEKLKKRPDYGLPDIVFRNLPPFPEKFYRMRVLIQYGMIYDLTDLGAEYYKQPEFYPQFEASGVGAMLSPPPDRWGAFGFGSYPGDTVVTTRPGRELTLVTFFHTSWLVETYQGLALGTVYKETSIVPEADLSGSYTVEQDPDLAKNYFEVSYDPQIFLLDPAFPIFGREWAKKILVKVKIKEGTPPGRYVIGVTAVKPPQEYIDRWIKEYLNQYTSAGGVGVGRPFYQITITVVAPTEPIPSPTPTPSPTQMNETE